jgi:DNA/RNA endonuclease G (NUC1)
VSWHLDNSWYGTLARVDTFRPDPKVDPSWYRVQAFDYAGSGFDRGHMTPNADRDNQNRIPINQETYLMSNMVPQSPDNNQGPWAAFEAYLRTQSDAGNELYIVSGPNGVGGTGSNGSATTIANGHVTVPASTWKVVLLLPAATGDDVARVTCSSRTLAVLMPNVQGIRTNDWHTYLTTIDNIEQLTGYDFYSNLPPAVQACIEAGSDGTNPPGTADQSASTTEDNSVTVTLTALQSNSDPLTFSIMSNPASGSLGSVSAASCTNGTCTATVTYTPGADFNGSDSFTFRANDGSVHSNISTVTVGVSEVNDAPAAADDSKSTSEDTPLAFPSSDLTANDSAGPANESVQVLTVTSVTADANTHGTVELAGGTVSYTPAANYNGPASFTYSVCDDGTTNSSPDSKCTTATVNVTVDPVNDSPTAADDSATTDEDTSVTINVLANDSDVENDSLTISAVTQGAHGSVVNNGVDVTYSPAANYHGSDSFTYTANDGHGGTAVATVNVTINAVNDNPVAVNDSASTNEDNSVTIDVVANDTDVDGDSLSLTSVGVASHGSVSIVSGKASYSPAANYNGSDSFGYVVSDGHGGQANGSVNVTINPVNDAPTANNQSANTASNTPVAITLTGNDLETPSGSLTFTVTSGPSHGSLAGSGANLTYMPGPNYSGPDSFKFTVTDTGDGSSAPLTSAEATVSITVNDTVAPTITLNGNSISLWPANHDLFTVNVTDLVAGASDNFDATVNLNSVEIAGVSSDEGTAASGDIVIGATCKSVQLRAERNGSDDGRVYTITFRVRDAAGNTGYATATVTVPHDQSHPDAVDSGAAYTVNSGCP